MFLEIKLPISDSKNSLLLLSKLIFFDFESFINPKGFTLFTFKKMYTVGEYYQKDGTVSNR